ncbi:hypothetical protein SAMN04489806_0469 [Paramicrobacterium humi]|uniref:Uncharacterized protein n=2 Tax=Paramicrobacterium humi TaxID=640635 RepID=A0A1H4J3F5_9MICO|nr:hypothetical protein SAMN04489806_0469 [Microbacterium humi]
MSELLVSMLVFSVLLTVVAGMYVSITRSSNQSQAIDASTRVAANAMNEVSLVIRNGTTITQASTTDLIAAFPEAKSDSLTVYSILDSTSAGLTPVKVQFWINADRELIETRWAATKTGEYWTWPSSTPSTSRNLSGSLLVSEEKPLFTYLDEAGTKITGGTNGTLSPDQRAKVTSVSITMRVEAADGGADLRTVDLDNVVGVPNLGNVRQE